MRFKLLSPLRNVVFELTHPKRGSSQPEYQNVTVFNQLRDTRTQAGYSGYSGILGDSGILGLDGQEQRMSGSLCLVLFRLDKQTTDRISSKSADRMLTAEFCHFPVTIYLFTFIIQSYRCHLQIVLII